MKVIIEPTADPAASPVVEIPPNGYALFSFHDLPAGAPTSGHKIQVLVEGQWEDFLAWPRESSTMSVSGGSDEILYVRVYKEATEVPVGVRLSPTTYLEYTVSNLFNSGQDGIVIDPFIMESMYQDEAGTTPVTADGQNVYRKESTVNGYIATQSESYRTPVYREIAGPPRLTIDKNSKRLELTVPAGGFNGTMVLATPEGIAIYGVSIPEGDFYIGGQSNGRYFPTQSGVNGGIVGMVIRDGAMSQQEIDEVTDWLINQRSASALNYSGVTDIEEYWREHSWITEFPLLDLSNVTNARLAWWDCTSMTELPLLDLSNALDIEYAWNNCNSLTSFPAIDMPSVTTARNAWEDCTSLTSFPAIDLSSADDFTNAWRNCSSLITFSLVDMSSALNIEYAWRYCSSLTSFPLLNLSNVTDAGWAWNGCSSLTEFPLVNLGNATNIGRAWSGCNSLTEFPLIDLSSVENAYEAWLVCSGLTSFPAIDMPNAISVARAWRGCSSLVEFPLIDLSSAENISETWENCEALTSFSALNLINVTDASSAWRYCHNLTSFPSISFPSLVNANAMWMNCLSLADFPANMFDGCPCTDFSSAFTNTNLTEQSIDNILVSINSNGTYNGIFEQSGGQGVSSVGQQAGEEMETRGWIVYAEGYVPPPPLPPLATFTDEAEFEADDTITPAMIEGSINSVEITNTGYSTSYGTIYLLYKYDPGDDSNFFTPIVNQNGVWAKLDVD